ncbi:hypothetical protein CCACVL1_24939 [Corchorus capsularis]|uniref:Uncharacterized protein n=1 Tax=Corchorus capsularis TaxID=210143 RepID=A0A1R3GME8_COCAP|nr:hypothetical protein CCACVL1_24939 [Corchorus capsularis]
MATDQETHPNQITEQNEAMVVVANKNSFKLK